MLKNRDVSSWPLQILLLLPLALLFSFDPQALDPALNPRLLTLSLALVPAFLFSLMQPRFRASLRSIPSLVWLLFLLIEFTSWLYHGCGVEGLVVLLKDLAFYLLFLLVAAVNWTNARLNSLGRRYHGP